MTFLSKTPTYRSWAGMRSRCAHQKDPSYYRYGARGISVCAEWATFAGFLADMGERPEGLTLDRIDNDKGYEPGNCCWAHPLEQAANRSTTHWVTYDGRTQHMTEWARELGTTAALIRWRLRKGWPLADALTQEVRSWTRHSFI